MSKSTTRRARRMAARWEMLLAEQSRSGLTQEAFCRLRGLGYSTFGFWRARCAKSANARAKRKSVTPRAELELGNGMVLRIGAPGIGRR